ncbi:MAG: alpha/beta fold hydrolase [Dehalococcoidia bacterium]
MPTAHINGIDISYECLGEGVPLLFIHGGYGGATTTLSPRPHEVRDILPRDHIRTIVYDRRNAFRSGYTDDHYDLETLAAEAAGLLDHLGIDRAIICGSSAGGPIALQFALTRPERVIALCLPNTSAYLANPERPVGRSRLEWVEHARTEGDRAAFEARKEALRKASPIPANPRPDDAARVQKLQDILTALSDDDLYHYAKGELRNYEAYIGWDYSDRLAELHMPVCVIHGTSDNTVPFDWGHALHKGIPHSEFHAIEGADHGVLSYPAAADVLRQWVGRITG